MLPNSVLIVEDDENKRTQLKRFLISEAPDCSIEEAQSLMGGLRKLFNGLRPDLVLLDMTIPNFDPSADEPGGATHGFGGRDFLIELERMRIPVPVIVVTQFKTFGKPPNEISVWDLDLQLQRTFAPQYIGIVSYDAALSNWKERLTTLMIQALKAGSSDA